MQDTRRVPLRLTEGSVVHKIISEEKCAQCGQPIGYDRDYYFQATEIAAGPRKGLGGAKRIHVDCQDKPGTFAE